MKVVGFTFIRNAEKFDYPVKESILSVLPIVHEFIVILGNSSDNTEEIIQSIPSSKIKIIPSIWDETLRQKGEVLASETNKGIANIPSDADWAIYIQADEVLHEKYLSNITNAMQKFKENPMVNGLLLKYVHFFGSYDYVGDSRRWYRREIRIIKNNEKIRSYKDAQGFRFSNNKKLQVKEIDAYVYHYGWVREPAKQTKKLKEFGKIYNNHEYNEEPVVEEFDYSMADSLKMFKGEHPLVMHERIKRKNWNFNADLKKKNFGLRYKVLYIIEKLTGWRIGEYKNYIKI
jgi:glycosyltransferase involved in cell wall biosynthesis